MFCFYAVVIWTGINVLNALNNGLALTPPMGWMSWGYFMCNISCRTNIEGCISEDLIKLTIDKLVENGYRDSGYTYVIIDDCWSEQMRDNEGRLVADRNRFPNGIKKLSHYAHARSMKLGIYGDFGNKTCTGMTPGSINFLELDAKTFADWEVDYVKFDGCFGEPEEMDIGYPLFGYFLNKTGRPMVYSCSWPYYQRYVGIEPNYRYIAKHCNLWRNYWDIQDKWPLISEIANYYAYKQDSLIPHAGPGHWNDPDQIMIGAPGLSVNEAKAQMAIWCILSAPLIMSNDVANIAKPFRDVLLNRRAIEINQDPLAKQGRMLFQRDMVQVWMREITPLGTYAIAFIYPYDDIQRKKFTFTPRQLDLYNPNGYAFSDIYAPPNEPGRAHIGPYLMEPEWLMTPGSLKTIVIPCPGAVFVTATPL